MGQTDRQLQVELHLVLLVSDGAAAGVVVVFDRLAFGLDIEHIVEAVEAVSVVGGHQGDLSHRPGRGRAPEINMGCGGSNGGCCGGSRAGGGVSSGGAGFEGSVGLRVDSPPDELPLDVGVPVVFDLVIGPTR